MAIWIFLMALGSYPLYPELSPHVLESYASGFKFLTSCHLPG